MDEEHKQSFEYLLSHDENLKIFNNTVPAGILVLRVDDGKVVFSNQFFYQTLGLEGDQVLGSSWDQFFVDPEERQSLMLKFVNHDEVHDYGLRLKRRDGGVVWGLASMSALLIEEEDLLLFSFIDISRLKATEAALQNSKEVLELKLAELATSQENLERQGAELVEYAEQQAELNQRLKYEADVKNQFFSIISHDLKGPFTSLLGMTKMMSQMADGLSKDKLVEYAADVNGAGERVFDLMQNLLEWSRLQMEGAKQEPTTILLDELVEQSIGVFKPIALEKGIVLSSLVANSKAFADPHMVQTVIRNLIANSLKFTPSGGTVEVSSCQDGDLTQVTVTDTGVGMSTEQADKIFSLDEKTSTTGTAGEKGTGLGLPICKDMIERNDGRIWVESKQGQGTQFHFVIPTELKKS